MPGGVTFLTSADANIPTPPASKVTVYFSTDLGLPAYKDSSGVVHSLVGNTGVAGPVGPIFPHDDGLDGDIGPQGLQGPQGPAGINANGIPIIGGTAAHGRRATWLQKADANNSSTMVAVGMAAATITGGSGTFDNSGFWATPIGGSGGTGRISAASAFCRVDHLPKCITRIRTPNTLANTRLFGLSLNEYLNGVNTDSPSLTTQRGIYVRYSTSAGDGGWVCQTVDGAGRSVSGTILAIATSTIYVITMTVIDTTHVLIDINGSQVTVTANIITGINLGYESSNNAITAFTPQYDCESIYLEAD